MLIIFFDLGNDRVDRGRGVGVLHVLVYRYIIVVGGASMSILLVFNGERAAVGDPSGTYVPTYFVNEAALAPAVETRSCRLPCAN